MRRFFYWVVAVAMLVAFFRSDLADDLIKGNDLTIGNWFNQISAAAEQKVMSDFRNDAQVILANLKPHQIEYANHLMKDRETLGVFYLRYCKDDDINPYIYGHTRTEFCDLIGKAGILRYM